MKGGGRREVHSEIVSGNTTTSSGSEGGLDIQEAPRKKKNKKRESGKQISRWGGRRIDSTTVARRILLTSGKRTKKWGQSWAISSKKPVKVSPPTGVYRKKEKNLGQGGEK